MNKENNISNEKLFGSKTRAKLLELFFANVNKTFYVRVRRELTNLESIGVIRNETYDNKVYYAANMRHPYAHAFQEMFGQRGAVTPGRIQQVRRTPSNSWDEYIKPVAKYLRAMMLMNRAPGQDGIDLLIIGDDRTKKLTRWAEVVEQKQGKPLDYVILSRDDFLYRKSVKDRFVMDILEMDPAEVFDPDGIIAGEGMY